MIDPQVVMNLTKALNRVGLVMEKRLAFDQEQAALRERKEERRRRAPAVRGRKTR